MLIMESVRVFVALLFVNICFGSIFDHLLDSPESCSQQCAQEFSTGLEEQMACQRGCRLYTIVEFACSGFECVENKTLNDCSSSCSEAYKMLDTDAVCVIGCQKQMIVSEKLRKQSENEAPTLHMLTPLYHHMYNVYSNMKNDIQHVMSVSWTVYVQNSNGEIITAEDEPQPVFRRIDALPKHSSASTGSDFLDCLSLRSGLPRWFLAVTIFFSSMVMIWLCFATTVTAPEQHVKQKMNSKPDLEYLKLADLEDEKPIKVDLCSDNAPQIPLKIDMDKV